MAAKFCTIIETRSGGAGMPYLALFTSDTVLMAKHLDDASILFHQAGDGFHVPELDPFELVDGLRADGWITTVAAGFRAEPTTPEAEHAIQQAELLLVACEFCGDFCGADRPAKVGEMQLCRRCVAREATRETAAAARLALIATELEEAVAASEAVVFADAVAAVRVGVPDATEAEVLGAVRELVKLGLMRADVLGSWGAA